MMLDRRTCLLLSLGAGSAVFSGSCRSSLSAEGRLTSPFDVRKVQRILQEAYGTRRCPSIEPPVAGIAGVQFYLDRRGSRASTELLRRDVAAAAPIERWLRIIEDLTSLWLVGRDEASAVCGLNHLRAWAESGALTGNFNQQGDFRRKWALGGAALCYLILREAPSAAPETLRIVAGWLLKIAKLIAPRYDRQESAFISATRNNHAYWAGLAVGAAAIAGNDHGLFDWAMKRLDMGLRQVSNEGFLPLELKRGRLALGYHLVAFSPLAALERMSVSNGRAMSSEATAAMDRLQKFCFEGLSNPRLVDDLAGAQQGRPESDERPSFRDGAGFEIRLGRVANVEVSNRLKKFRPVRNRWLGGNVTLLWNPASLPNAQ